MPSASTAIDFHVSGGASTSDPDASLGGVISSTQITDATIANLFDNVSGAEAAAGDTEYRCFYIKNNHGSLTLQGAEVWIETNTPSTDTSAEIGLGTAAVNGTEQTVADEETAPTGVTFSTAAGSGNALSIGDIPASEHKAIWVKRVVSAAAAAHNSDSVVIKIQGDTAA